MAETPAPAPPAPPPPVPAPVTLTNVNTLDLMAVITSHMWQEYHWKAPTNVYKGHADEDKKVAEIKDDQGALVVKDFINMGFCEWAMATIEADFPDDQELYLRWWIEDMNGTVLREHEDYTKANFDSKNAKAKLVKGKHAWRWDGRRKNASNHLVFVPTNQPYWSKIEVKNKDGKAISTAPNQTAIILARGEPYKAFVVGVPKNDTDLQKEMEGRCGGRWLGTDGARMATDCWIKIYRGAPAAGDDGHIVFLGHGSMEATKIAPAGNKGAIATPHDKTLRGYIRSATHGGTTFWLFEIADESPNPSGSHLIALDAVAGEPACNNPYCDTFPNKPFKDGVHGHMAFTGGGTNFVVNEASVGCTTIKKLDAGTLASPVSVLGDVVAVKAHYGTWNGGAPSGSANALWGPPLESSRPGTFYNKQNKRDAVTDAAIADNDDNPVLKPVVPGSTATPPATDEPLHMQPTVQHAVFGGFMGHEVSTGSSTPAEPAEGDDPKLRLRITLQNPPENSRGWQYHRLVVFGHKVDGMYTATIEAWVPRMVQRLWNGHPRNLAVEGKCQYAWYFEQRNPDGSTQNLGYIGTKPAGTNTHTNLDDIGRFRKQNVKIPTLNQSTTSLGTTLWSVFEYKVLLEPAPAAGSSSWGTLAAQEDLFTEVFSRAELVAETIVTEGGKQYLVGKSEVPIPVDASQYPNLPPPGGSPGGPTMPA